MRGPLPSSLSSLVKFVDNTKRRASFGPARAPRFLKENLRAALKQRQISQKSLASFLGVHEMTVSQWCRGTKSPSDENQALLIEAVGVPAEFFRTKGAHVGLKLGRAVRPGEFLPVDPEPPAQPLRSMVIETAARNMAEHERQLALRAEEQERQRVRRALADLPPNTKWSVRSAIAGDRCMMCAVAMPTCGICNSCFNPD
jgi:transcriptional regulator with XRE-family HTH domain